jgi:hypothetical protein
MAGPGKKGRPSAEESDGIIRAHHLIIKLRRRYCVPYKRLADITGYHPDHCRRIFRESYSTEVERSDRIDDQRLAIILDIETVLDIYRQWILGTPEEPPPVRAHVEMALKLIEAKWKVLERAMAKADHHRAPEPVDIESAELAAERFAVLAAVLNKMGFNDQPIFDVK